MHIHVYYNTLKQKINVIASLYFHFSSKKYVYEPEL